MRLDSRLNWKHRVRQRQLQIDGKTRELYWEKLEDEFHPEPCQPTNPLRSCHQTN